MQFVEAKTIKACSPDRRHHSGFVKDGGTYVYVEAWSAEEVKAAHPYLEGAPELTEMLRRFEQVGGNLRVLLSNDKNYAKYVVQQKKDVENFEALIAASYGLLGTEGEKNGDKAFHLFEQGWHLFVCRFCFHRCYGDGTERPL